MFPGHSQQLAPDLHVGATDVGSPACLAAAGCSDWEALGNLNCDALSAAKSPHLVTHVSRLPEGEHLLLIRGSSRLWGKLTEAQV